MKIKVGDIFANSWGYGQTQVDFYEVVSLSKSGKTCTLKPIGFKWTKPESLDCSTVVPDRDGGTRFTKHKVPLLERKRITYGEIFDKEYACVNVTDPGDPATDHKKAYYWEGKPMYFTPRSMPGY